jgi:hypothetical protein
MLNKVLSFIVNALLRLLAVVHLDSPNRIVVALSPVFAGAAGWIVTEFASLAPGANLTKDQVTAVFVAGALFASAKVLLWLHGWQQHEKRSAPQPLATGVAGSARSDIGTV